jgi:hypothetical protein
MGLSDFIIIKTFLGKLDQLQILKKHLWDHTHALNVRVDLEGAVAILDRMKSGQRACLSWWQ